MVLDDSIDPKQLQQMSDQEKIELARKAYAEFLHIANEVSEHQKEILDEALDQLRGKKIEEVRAFIQQNFPDKR